MIDHSGPVAAFLAPRSHGDMIVGYNHSGEIEFGYHDKENVYHELLCINRPTFDYICSQTLGIRPPMFQDDMKDYLDKKFKELERLCDPNPLIASPSHYIRGRR